jgi:hypothetical protein
MAQYGKEGRALVQRLLNELDLDAEVSNNAKKQLRRALGSLIFSSDSVGYLDIVENAFAKGKTARQALMSVRSASEKLIESYAPVKGIFEAHHTQALSALRESYLTLPPSEQDAFLQMIEDRGWKLGDDPEQLVETVFSRMSHQGKTPELKKGDPTGMKGLFADSQVPAKELQGHPRGTRDALLQTKPGQFSTGADLFNHFETVIAPRAAEDAANALVQDAPARAAAAQQGLDLVEVTPEANIARASTPEGLEATRKGVEAFAQEYTPTDKGAREILQQVGEEPAEFLTRPTAIADMGEIIYPTVTGFTKNQIKKLARRTLVAGGGLLPLVGVGAQAAEVKKAEESGDVRAQTEEAGQLGLELASQVAPVADVANIGADLYQGYREMREAGASKRDIAKGVLDVGVEAIQNPGKVANVVKESFQEIPGQVMSGFQYLGQKLLESRSKLSISGYSPF